MILPAGDRRRPGRNGAQAAIDAFRGDGGSRPAGASPGEGGECSIGGANAVSAIKFRATLAERPPSSARLE
jgi:hypothetical protein